MRNRQLIVHWLMENTSAIEVKRRDGKTYYAVWTPDAGGKAWASFWPRCNGSSRKAIARRPQACWDDTASKFDPKLRDEVAAPLRETRSPVVHRLRHAEADGRPRRRGKITNDVDISYPLDLETQMLEWSGRRKRSSAGFSPLNVDMASDDVLRKRVWIGKAACQLMPDSGVGL